MVTLKNNYIYKTSGRAPKVAGNTVLHAVNNYWQGNSGHAFETSDQAKILAEGNLFQDVKAAIEQGSTGAIFAAPDASANAACSNGVGHVCEVNKYDNSGSLSGSDSSFFSTFGGKGAEAKPAGDLTGLASSAGFGTI
jgi:pectin lyase